MRLLSGAAVSLAVMVVLLLAAVTEASSGPIPGEHEIEVGHGTVLPSVHSLEIGLSGNITAEVLTFDLTGDGNEEIILGTSKGLYVISRGTSLYRIPTPGPIVDTVLLNKDTVSSPQLVLAINDIYFPNIRCYDSATGARLWDFVPTQEVFIDNVMWAQQQTSTFDIEAVDLDQDGSDDIVATSGYNVFALDGEDGSTLWESTVPQDWMYHGGSFADLDEDGKNEIAIGCYDSHVYVLKSENGAREWDYPTSTYAGGPTSIADLDDDDHLEIVFTAHNLLGVLSHTGGLEWDYWAGGSIFRGAAIADIDGDDHLDVVFGSDDGVLRALRGRNGQVIWTEDLEAHYGQTFQMDHAPVIADFDGDGRLDVFIVGGYGTSDPPTGNHGRAYALRAGDGMGAGWPMFRHDLRHSGCWTDESPPAIPATSVWGLLTTLLLATAVATLIFRRERRRLYS